MAYKLEEEHELIRESTKEIATQIVEPNAERIDKEELFPKDVLKQIAEQGYMGMTIADQYGGTGTDFLSYMIALEEIAKASGTVATIMMMHNSMVGFLLNHYAPESVKEEYLPKLASGELLGAAALSEPGILNYVTETKTIAENKGGYYELNGFKGWVTSGGEADVYVILAKDKESGKPLLAIVDKGAKGMHFGIDYKMLGLKGTSVRDLYLEGVQVPVEKVITENVDRAIRRVLDVGRVSVAAIAVGIAQISIDEAVIYCNQRKQFGRFIGKFGALQDDIGDIEIKTEAARQLVYHTASMLDDEYAFHMKAMKAKVFATETSAYVTKKSIRIHGGIAYTKDRPIERFARDSRGLIYLWDNNDILRARIARNLLGYDEDEEVPFPV
ncbi:MAG: acyl-CoA dehydrogenase family protein [Candidatus Njordarchaeia archaeon]